MILGQEWGIKLRDHYKGFYMAGEMAQRSGELAALSEDPVSGSQWLISVSSSGSKQPDILLSLYRHQACVWYTGVLAGKTPLHIT